MAISQVIKYEGFPDDLVWKYSGEEFNVSSQLIVDETHQAILVVNGQAADLFGPGRHILSVPNIPIVDKIIKIPTGGVNPFQCKIFYINQVHQMDMLWGTRGPITLDDPEYGIFLHITLCGSMTFSIVDSRKFLIKLAGFRPRFTSQDMIENFKGLVSSHVKDCISKMMITDGASYFKINANLFDTSETVKARLDTIFDEYGIRIEYFNIETIDVPKEDYELVTKAKERSSGRRIEGYSWKEEREMQIAETFAGNEGTMGNIGGIAGGFMIGGALAGPVTEMAKNAMSQNTVQNVYTSNNVANVPMQQANSEGVKVDGTQCPGCGNIVQAGSKFCNLCGYKLPTSVFCTNCGTQLAPNSKFCNECGAKV